MIRFLVALAALSLVATAGATEPMEPTPTTENWIDGPLGVIGFDVADGSILVEPMHTTQGRSLDILIFIGNETDAYPQEWVLFHLGNTTTATNHAGQTLEVTSVVRAHSVERTNGVSGDCIKVVAQAWHRVDGQKQVTDASPAGADPSTAWDDLPCHEQDGRQASAPEPAGDKDSPGPGALLVVALAGLAWMRRK